MVLVAYSVGELHRLSHQDRTDLCLRGFRLSPPASPCAQVGGSALLASSVSQLAQAHSDAQVHRFLPAQVHRSRLLHSGLQHQSDVAALQDSALQAQAGSLTQAQEGAQAQVQAGAQAGASSFSPASTLPRDQVEGPQVAQSTCNPGGPSVGSTSLGTHVHSLRLALRQLHAQCRTLITSLSPHTPEVLDENAKLAESFALGEKLDEEDGVPRFDPKHSRALGQPMICRRDQSKKSFTDGFGLCSPGRWPPEARGHLDSDGERARCDQVFALLDEFVKEKLPDVQRAAFQLVTEVLAFSQW